MAEKPWGKGDVRWFWVWLCTAPLLLLLAVEFTTRVSPLNVLYWMSDQAGALLLSYGVLWGLMFLMTLLTAKLWLGILIPSIPTVILCAVNYLKLSVNGVGLVVSDMSMAGNAGTLMEFMPRKLRLPAWGVVFAVLLIGGVVAAKLLVKELPEGLRKKRRRTLAGAVTAAAVAAALLAPWFYYIGPKGETQAERDDRLGLLLGLYGGVLRAASKPMNAPPEDIRPADPSEIIGSLATATPAPTSEASETPAPPVKPSVIMLMSESFCDPSVVLPGVEMNGDPVKNYHALAKEWPSGVFLSNSYAGGTGNVEMEVFTGIPAGVVPERDTLTTLSAEGAYSNAPSIVKAFAGAGYHTAMIHTYNDELYNRRSNLADIGFESMMFQNDFPEDAPMEGPYLSDMALTDAVIEKLEEKKDGDALFLYALSMGNHQPIFEDKYDEPSGFDPHSELLTDPDDLGCVDALIQGLSNADRALGALVDYLEDYDEPVLLVFWGDHLPGMYRTPDHSIFSALGYVPTADTNQWDADTIKKMCATEFVVWNNYGAELNVPEEIGALHLGSQTLGWAGVEKPEYFRWVDVTERDLHLYRDRLFVDGGGKARTTLTEADEELLNNYRKLLFDVLYPKETQEWSSRMTDYAALGF